MVRPTAHCAFGARDFLPVNFGVRSLLAAAYRGAEKYFAQRPGEGPSLPSGRSVARHFVQIVEVIRSA